MKIISLLVLLCAYALYSMVAGYNYYLAFYGPVLIAVFIAFTESKNDHEHR